MQPRARSGYAGYRLWPVACQCQAPAKHPFLSASGFEIR
jgi:hypothetical protein